MKKVITVLGEIPADELGITMPHEHVICDISLQSGNENNRLTDIDTAIVEVAAYKKAGGMSIVDVTTVDIGRNPQALKQVSEATGVNIITATGLYSESIYPLDFGEKNVKSLAKEMIHEAENGIGETGIKPGVIGELGSMETEPSPAETMVLCAAARTHLETGLAVVIHSGLNRPGPNQVRILREESVKAERIIVSHADILWHENIEADLAYHLSLLDIGCYLSFDMIGWPQFSPEEHKIACIVKIIEKGYSDRLLLSSDLCRKTFYHKNSGRGYDYVLTDFVPRLKESGVSEFDMTRMLVTNPAEVLAVYDTLWRLG